MIITRSPLRLSLGGGGTDLASYYLEHEGFLIAGAIDKYVYLTIHQSWTEELILKYSRLEKVRSLEEVQHPIIREALRLTGTEAHNLEITSMADIPAGTGMGSSGSFTAALLRGLHGWKGQNISAQELAEEACHIEIDILQEPVGKQDQYAAAFGGLNCYTFHRDGSTSVDKLRVSEQTLHNLEDNLALFFTGYTRSASSILSDQKKRSIAKDQSMIDNLHFVKQIGLESKAALEAANLDEYVALMRRHWDHKKKRSQGISSAQIDEFYELGMRNGAKAGKLIGAGGGGFLMFYSEDKTRLRRAMYGAGLREVRFRFDFEGSQVVNS